MRRANQFLLYLLASILVSGCSSTLDQSSINPVGRLFENSFQVEEENFSDQLQSVNNELAFYIAKPGRDRINDLISVYNKYGQLEASIRRLKGEYSVELIPVLKKIVLVNNYFYFYPKSYVFSKKYTPTNIRQYSNNPLNEVASSQDLFSLTKNTLPNRAVPFIKFSYQEGKKAHDSIISIYCSIGDVESEECISAIVAAADWEFVVGRKTDAKKLFRQARQLIDNLEDNVLSKRLKNAMFNTPKLLVDPKLFGFVVVDLNKNRVLFEEGATSKPSPKNEYITITFEIRRIGTARNLEVIDSKLMDKSDLRLREVKKLVRAELLFRPQYIKSETMDTQRLRYQISLAN